MSSNRFLERVLGTIPAFWGLSLFWVSLCFISLASGSDRSLSDQGEISGVVRREGPVPKSEVMVIEPKKGAHSTEGCGSLVKASQKLIVNERGEIQNAVVWLDLPFRAEDPSGALLLNQRECVFEPHVVAMAPGGTLSIRNSDPATHNIRIFREGKPSMLMHRWQKQDASDIVWKFDEPGRYVVRCGIHPWMHAWVMVVPSRAFAVTDGQGRFLISKVPTGRYTLHLWHESLGSQNLPVEVGSDRQTLKPILFADQY